MGAAFSETRAHTAACVLSEGARQAAVQAAGNNQAAIRTAEILHLRTCLESCKKNNGGAGSEPFIAALKDLWGSAAYKLKAQGVPIDP